MAISNRDLKLLRTVWLSSDKRLKVNGLLIATTAACSANAGLASSSIE